MPYLFAEPKEVAEQNKWQGDANPHEEQCQHCGKWHLAKVTYGVNTGHQTG